MKLRQRLRFAAAASVALPLCATPSPLLAQARTKDTVEAVGLRTEYATGPLGIDVRKPRLSWQLQSGARGVVQSAYQVQVSDSERSRLLWDSGRVASSESTQRAYDGPPLSSARRYFWQVRVWDGAGRASGWSAPAWWEMGLLEPGDWKASWIEPGLTEDVTKPGPVPMLRREFQLRGPVERARAYVTAHGLYELYLNGQRAGDQLFTPGWTSYDNRLQYQTYDVTPLLKAGANAVGALLGNGWYRGNLGGQGRRNIYGDRLGLLAQIEVTYKDGHRETIGTDSGWKASTGPILMSEIYHGETYDARLEKPGWATAGFDDSGWSGVKVAETPQGRSHRSGRSPRQANPGAPAGQDLHDAGGRNRRRHGAEHGRLGEARGGRSRGDDGHAPARRGPRQGRQLLHREPAQGAGDAAIHAEGRRARNVRATFHVLRVPLRRRQRLPGELTPESLTGVVVHSAMAPAGEFETSKPLVNQLQHNIVWGQKGNFLDVPTDCPQRDERLGWTGDAQVFSPTAAFNMDVAGFFTKWLGDVAADQYDDGSVPHVIPNVLPVNNGRRPSGAAGWADAAVIIPWTMYLSYGDKRILEQQYDSMARWVGYEKGRAGDDLIWDGDFHFGDWLAYAAPPGEARAYPGATTGTDLLATAFFAHSTDLLSRAARILGKTEDSARYAQQLSRIKEAFVREYVTTTGRVGENTQTAYAVALQFDLLPEELRATAAKRLAQDVRQRKHLTTGFLGTPYLCHVLTRYGYLDEAYLLLNREEYPSWLYPVKQGATTIWERWDGQKPDGTFQDVGMNSFNHYAYGAIGDWMYRVMAGIDTDEAAPGYKHILIQPRPGGGFTEVRASHDTPYGKVASAWTRKDGTFELRVEVPGNTRATVRLPKAQLTSVTEGGQPLATGNGIGGPKQDGDTVVVEVGSGAYRFAYPSPD